MFVSVNTRLKTDSLVIFPALVRAMSKSPLGRLQFKMVGRQ